MTTSFRFHSEELDSLMCRYVCNHEKRRLQITKILREAYCLRRKDNCEPFIPASEAEWISFFFNPSTIRRKTVLEPEQVYFPFYDKQKLEAFKQSQNVKNLLVAPQSLASILSAPLKDLRVFEKYQYNFIQIKFALENSSLPVLNASDYATKVTVVEKNNGPALFEKIASINSLDIIKQSEANIKIPDKNFNDNWLILKKAYSGSSFSWFVMLNNEIYILSSLVFLNELKGHLKSFVFKFDNDVKEKSETFIAMYSRLIAAQIKFDRPHLLPELQDLFKNFNLKNLKGRNLGTDWSKIKLKFLLYNKLPVFIHRENIDNNITFSIKFDNTPNTTKFLFKTPLKHNIIINTDIYLQNIFFGKYLNPNDFVKKSVFSFIQSYIEILLIAFIETANTVLNHSILTSKFNADHHQVKFLFEKLVQNIIYNNELLINFMINNSDEKDPNVFHAFKIFNAINVENKQSYLKIPKQQPEESEETARKVFEDTNENFLNTLTICIASCVLGAVENFSMGKEILYRFTEYLTKKPYEYIDVYYRLSYLSNHYYKIGSSERKLIIFLNKEIVQKVNEKIKNIYIPPDISELATKIKHFLLRNVQPEAPPQGPGTPLAPPTTPQGSGTLLATPGPQQGPATPMTPQRRAPPRRQGTPASPAPTEMLDATEVYNQILSPGDTTLFATMFG